MVTVILCGVCDKQTAGGDGSICESVVCREVESLRTENAELIKDVGIVLDAFDDCIFVRDIKHDSDSGLAMKRLGPLAALLDSLITLNVNPGRNNVLAKCTFMVRKERLELPHLSILEPKSSASTNSATLALVLMTHQEAPISRDCTEINHLEVRIRPPKGGDYRD